MEKAGGIEIERRTWWGGSSGPAAKWESRNVLVLLGHVVEGHGALMRQRSSPALGKAGEWAVLAPSQSPFPEQEDHWAQGQPSRFPRVRH